MLNNRLSVDRRLELHVRNYLFPRLTIIIRSTYKDPINFQEWVRILHTAKNKRLDWENNVKSFFSPLFRRQVAAIDPWRDASLRELCLHKIAKKDPEQHNNHHKHEWEATALLAHLFPQKLLQIVETRSNWWYFRYQRETSGKGDCFQC